MAEWHDTTEEYLEAIYSLEEEGVRPMRARIVEMLGLSAAAVSETVARLAEHGHLRLLEDRTIELTTQGRKIATTVVRRHRLAERLLADVIGLEWEKVHKEAARWEHAISAEVEEKLVELLGDPATCPHGNAIPGTRRGLSREGTVTLASAPAGRVTVDRISERLELDDASLRFIVDARLIPGASATVVAARAATAGAVTVLTATGEHQVLPQVAAQLYVTLE